MVCLCKDYGRWRNWCHLLSLKDLPFTRMINSFYLVYLQTSTEHATLYNAPTHKLTNICFECKTHLLGFALDVWLALIDVYTYGIQFYCCRRRSDFRPTAPFAKTINTHKKEHHIACLIEWWASIVAISKRALVGALLMIFCSPCQEVRDRCNSIRTYASCVLRYRFDICVLLQSNGESLNARWKRAMNKKPNQHSQKRMIIIRFFFRSESAFFFFISPVSASHLPCVWCV